MIRPKYNGRPMNLIKKYQNFALFVDEKTGIRMAFSYHDLQEKRTKQIDNEELAQYRRKPGGARH